MNKSTRAEVNKARSAAATYPAYAATSLATLMRSATSKKLAQEIENVIDELDLKAHLLLVNGCYVPR